MKSLTELLMTEKVEINDGTKFFINHPLSVLPKLLDTLEYRTVRFVIWPRHKMFVYWDAASPIYHGYLARGLPGLNPNEWQNDWYFSKIVPTGFIGLDRLRPNQKPDALVSMFYAKQLEAAEIWKKYPDEYHWMNNYITRIKAASIKVFIDQTTGGFTGYTGNDTH